MSPTDAQRTILIFSAAGNIGSELVPLLVREQPEAKLVLPTRSAEKLRASNPSSTADHVVINEGDIADPVWIESLIHQHNVDSVFLCIHGGEGGELDITLNILDAMHRAGTVKQVVYVSICGDFVTPSGIENLSRLCSAGHMLVKIPIESKLKFGGFGWSTTVLGPTLFFTNDERSKRGMLDEGVFDEPLEWTSRVHPRDIALAARNVFFAPEGKYDGKKIQIGSLKTYSGAEVAQIWSKALGKEIRPWGSKEGEDMATFEAQHVGKRGKRFARDMRLMYENFMAAGFRMSKSEYELQVEVLEKEAESYEEWVGKKAKEWSRD